MHICSLAAVTVMAMTGGALQVLYMHLCFLSVPGTAKDASSESCSCRVRGNVTSHTGAVVPRDAMQALLVLKAWQLGHTAYVVMQNNLSKPNTTKYVQLAWRCRGRQCQ